MTESSTSSADELTPSGQPESTARAIVIPLLVILFLIGSLGGALAVVNTLDFAGAPCGGPGYGDPGPPSPYGCVPGGGSEAAHRLSVSPARVVFPTTKPFSTSFALVTITNGGDTTEDLITATANPTPPFFADFGGTCNVVYAFHIPSGASCTFQWGFAPGETGNYNGIGEIKFASDTTLRVVLAGQSV
jgi:hypothetical protein